MWYKLKRRLTRKWQAFLDWYTRPYEGYLGNGEVITGSFLAGSGKTFWAYVIVFTIYGLVTGQKLGWIKK